MYRDYFGLKESPFSIAPDPRYLYMSERHKEALAHLLYGVSGQGGFVVLTGEVGTGKTTICRCFLQQVPENTDVAFIVNPKLSARELLANICDEFGIVHPPNASIKIYNDLLSGYLLQAHSEGRHTVLVIDEAQNLRVDVLEQLRLLTNLETSEKKLLQIILLGQPELQDMLAQKELRQLAQRVTARYHLTALNKDEVVAYIRYRLGVAGQKQALFKPAAIKKIFRKTGGIPRLINLVCDRALLGAYAQSSAEVSVSNVKMAFKEIKGEERAYYKSMVPMWVVNGAAIGIVFGGLLTLLLSALSASNNTTDDVQTRNEGKDSLILSTTKAMSGVIDSTSTLSEASVSETSDECEYGDGCGDTVENDVTTGNIDPKQRYGRKYVASLKYTPPPFNSKLLAYESVLKLWNVAFPADNPKFVCEFVGTVGLDCLHKKGNWRGLMKINRPVILRLENRSGKEYFVGLLAIEGEYGKISLGQKVIWTSLESIEQQWLGDYSVIWKLPSYKSSVIKPGDIRSSDEWLATNILKVKAIKTGSSGDVGRIHRDDDSPVSEKVRWFQKEVGLKSDGIAGAHTLIQLNNFITPNVPLLVRDITTAELPKPQMVPRS